MEQSVLILAPDTDPHACAVAWALEQQGVTPLLTPSLQAMPGVHYAFHIDGDGEQWRDSMSGASHVSAVWNRRLQDPQPVCAEADKAFASLEWKLFQRNVFSLAHAYGDALWVNPLPESIRAEHKLVQLSACRRLGVPFPDTVVTTDAREVDALRKKWDRVIFKSFMMHQWMDQESHEQHSVGVALLDRHSELPAESIAICPGIYQRYIDKAFDVRVTVMGERMFALSLRKRTAGGYVDWRGHTGSTAMQAEAMVLPPAVESGLRALMRELGLVFGCIDLAVDREGHYYFLEVNQAGQFLFVEEMAPELPMLRSMAALLSRGSMDAGDTRLRPVTMQAFRASDAYAALKQRVSKLSTADEPLFSLE